MKILFVKKIWEPCVEYHTVLLITITYMCFSHGFTPSDFCIHVIFLCYLPRVLNVSLHIVH